MFKKLRTVIYHAKDLHEAKNWYTRITGVKPYFDESFYVGFNIFGCELGIDPDFSGVTGGTRAIAYWQVDDIDDCVQRLKNEGADLKTGITEVGEGIRVATLLDPFGNTFGIIEEKVSTA